MARAERQAFPELEAPTEGQRRAAITAPMVQNVPQDVYGGRTDEELRQMELDLLGVEMPSTPKAKSNVPLQIKYKDEVFDAGSKMSREELQKTQNSETKPEWAKITEGLFNPPPNAPQEKIDELLQNAWEEITLTYSEDRETMKKAHTYLIALDNNLEIKPE